MRKKLHTKICSVVLSAIMLTSLFTGCSADSVQPSTSEVDSTPAVTTSATTTVSTTTSITTTVSDNVTNPTPGATDANSDFSIKYKYWYDSDYTKESQPNPDTTAIDSINADKQLFGLEDLPIHTDENGNEFIMSGRRQVYLENGKLPLAELVLLRTEGESADGGGQRVYTVEDPASTTKELEAFDSMLEANGIVPPTSIEERQTADSLADEKTIPEGLTIFVNNLETDFTTTADGMIDISAIYAANNALGTVMVPNDSQAQVVMNTAAGQVTVSFGVDESTVSVSYSMEMDKTTLENTDITLVDNTMQLTPDALERTLGYDVEVYEDAGFINIVTDNRDLFTAETLVDTEDIPKYVNVGQVIVVEDEKPEPSKPETQTTPDGKYDLAATDLVNTDGTYTQTLGSGDPSSVTVPSACTGEFSAWNAESASNPARRGKSNPSQIPYSQITLENAHEAFPYMGFTGQHPGYIEILPSDSPDIIAGKIWNNLVGNESFGTGRNYEGYGFGYMPEHVFSSEAEYNAYVADQEAQRAAADAAAQKSAEENANGDYGFSDADAVFEEMFGPRS